MIKIDKMINKMMIFKNFMVYKNWNLYVYTINKN